MQHKAGAISCPSNELAPRNQHCYMLDCTVQAQQCNRWLSQASAAQHRSMLAAGLPHTWCLLLQVIFLGVLDWF